MAAEVSLILLALAACLVALALGLLKERKGASNIPGPPALPLIGHALEFLNVSSESLLPTLLRLIDGRPMCRLFIVTHSLVIISDPDGVGEVVRHKDLNDKSVFAYSLLHLGAKLGLIQMSGPEWKQHRAWLAPGFKKSILNTFVSDFSHVSKDFTNKVRVNQDVEVRSQMTRMMTKAFVLTAALGKEWEQEEEIEVTMEFIDRLFHAVMRRSFNPLLWAERVFKFTSEGRSIIKMSKVIDSYTQNIIDTKREALKHKKAEEPGAKGKTLMDIMIDTDEHQEHMSEEAIRDEVKTMFGAAVETTATGLCWALKILSLLPDEQERLCAELEEVFPDSERGVSAEDLPKLKYMDRFFKEVLRMFPPVPLLGRQCHSETVLMGHRVPADSTILMNLVTLHRDPRHWPEPGRFDPDRFLGHTARARHPYAYIPFSAGSRNCIGGTYAVLLMMTFLATTLRAFSVQPVNDGHKDLQSLADHMTYAVTSGLPGGFHVRFVPRSTKS